ncbi:staphylococcal-like nuclease can1 [Quercus suber]|uniref:Staphylococcal-like nuclease can1 n=1 Tax=Quercus suber TaxID=58331 RepID=A0AAW0K7N1_QUESU
MAQLTNPCRHNPQPITNRILKSFDDFVSNADEEGCSYMSWLSIRFKEMVTASFMLYLINCIVLLTTTLFKENRLLNSLNITRKCTGGYVPMANNDYLKKMSKSGEWGDHVTLQAAADWGLLAFYGLPLPHTLVQLTVGVPTSMPAGVKYEVQTFPLLNRGIDAPENEMPYGKEAKEELTKIVQGKCLRVLVYGEDRYGRCVVDIYCDGKFVQVLFLCTLVSFVLVNAELTYPSFLTARN